jgi:hypothetical protein
MPKPAIEVYQDLGIPPNLQRHMLRVAGIAEWIAERWAGPHLNLDLLRRVLLLHDVGNIVKGDYIKRPELLEEEAHNAPHWVRVQEKYIERYGTDDHVVSRVLAAAVGLTPDELNFMDAKIFIRNDETAMSHDYNLKVAAYADQRVAPFGVLPLETRLREAQQRYRDVPGSSMNNPRTEFLILCAVRIEAQIAAYSRESLSELTDQAIQPYIDSLMNYVI